MSTLPRLNCLAFAVLAAALIGCGKKAGAPPSDDPGAKPGQKPDPKADPKYDPKTGTPGGPAKPADGEDPAVLAHIKAKGWSLNSDLRISDGKRLVYLSVENKGKPLEKATLTDDDYKTIARSKTLQVLDLRNVECTDDGLKAVAGIPQLEGILVNGESVTDAGVAALAASRSLDNVTLFSTKKVTDAGVKELAKLPRLQTLYLAFFALDGSAFEPFANCKTLTSLTLEYIDGLTDDGAGHIAKIPNLNELKIGSGFGEKKLTAAGIKAIVDARLPAKFEFDKKLIDDELLASLVKKGWLYGPTPPGARDKRPATAQEVRFLNLDDSKITDKGFEAVADCTNATAVHLQRTAITDETLRKLANFKKLDYLALEKTKVTAAGLEAVSGLPLKHLAMQECELTEDSFKAFGKMTALEELWLSGAKMKAEWLKHVAALPKLKELNLMRADFDDAAVKHVTTMPGIEDLTLNDTNLTDAGFRELLKLPKLRKLFVDGTKVSKEVYQKAKKDHPKVSLYFYRYDN